MIILKNVGAKIVVHDPALPPMPDEYGIDIQPNSANTIAVQAVSTDLPRYSLWISASNFVWIAI